jgi:hemerythrin-like domain-containing protein
MTALPTQPEQTVAQTVAQTVTQTVAQPSYDDPNGPADTRTMRIVHNAMRRDLARARDVLTTTPYPHPVQRQALGEHLAWMMSFLHHHHSGEDAGLYPLVHAKNASAAALLDEMDADHHAIEPAMAELAAAGAAYAGSDAARQRAVAAIDALCDVLLPHLLREEQEMMPVVAASITKAEWDHWTQEFNVKPTPMSQLAIEGLWIMEGQAEQDRALMAELVPAIPRWIILNVVSRKYRKQAFRRWWSADHSPWKLRVAASTTVTVTASPERVWQVLADVTRTGEWSHECHTVRWLGGATRAALGARFEGVNRVGRFTWKRACTITALDEERELGFGTAGPLAKDATQWRFVLEPDGTGTRVTQEFRIVRMPVWYDRLIWVLTPAHRDRRPALHEDLVRLGEVAAAKTG